MDRTNQINNLRDAELTFIKKLDILTYSDSAAGASVPHYMLIEGVMAGAERKVSFIISDSKPEPWIVIGGCSPKAEQKLSIAQFYEWLNNPVKHKASVMQNQNFELSERLKASIKEQFKILRNG